MAAWVALPNGHCEARTFTLSDILADGAIADTLAGLSLQSLGTTQAADLRVRRSSPGQAWQMLFHAAANGGAYTVGEGGTQGRLSAWRSIAGLTGLSERADVAEVEYCAGTQSWYTFDPITSWFGRGGWDITVITVTADRRHLAILAATDID